MKKGLRPITRTANPEPQDKNSISWIIWAAWADRITFEDIKEKIQTTSDYRKLRTEDLRFILDQLDTANKRIEKLEAALDEIYSGRFVDACDAEMIASEALRREGET